MNIFDFVAPEEIKEDLEPCTRRSKDTPDNVSEEECGVTDEVLTADLYEDVTNHQSEIDTLYGEYEAASNDAIDISGVNDLLVEVSAEDMTSHKADFLNAHICGLQSMLALRGSDVNFTKYAPEDFDESVNPDVRAMLAAESEEDFKANAKKFIAIAAEKIKAVIKKIVEIVTRLLANTDKLKALAEAALAKAASSYTEPEGDMKVPSGLQVSGKLDVTKAISSYSSSLPETFKYIRLSGEDSKDMLREVKSSDLNKWILGISDGSKAQDAKIFAHLGGNVDVGFGGGFLYSINVTSEAQKMKPLSKSEIESSMKAVIKDFDAINKIGEMTKKVAEELEKNIKTIEGIQLETADGAVSKSPDETIQKLMAKLNAKSGIKVISRMGTLSYITCMDAIKVCEWSMSGKAEK